ncbi:hypothetical protein GCM10007876_35960 [Litoribrevibacter albus]|uniref:Uncharacterized protein n=1 Tax=Litoribrevibacter albus TaxID=1473156 RepID=A0AA37W7Z9_9GAMM|nr:hypothetical protein GCM10007876_35960 [Litoribrevibacter albus]
MFVGQRSDNLTRFKIKNTREIIFPPQGGYLTIRMEGERMKSAGDSPVAE